MILTNQPFHDLYRDNVVHFILARDATLEAISIDVPTMMELNTSSLSGTPTPLTCLGNVPRSLTSRSTFPDRMHASSPLLEPATRLAQQAIFCQIKCRLPQDPAFSGNKQVDHADRGCLTNFIRLL